MRFRAIDRERIRVLARDPRIKPFVRPIARLLRKMRGQNLVERHPLALSTDTTSSARQNENRDGQQRTPISTGRERSHTLHRLLAQLAEAYPTSDGCRYYARLPIRVAVITDIYMLNFYKDCFEECTYVKPDTVDDVIKRGFDVLLYISCWSGVSNDEWRGVKFRERPAAALEKLLQHCKKNDVVSIFQSIEDPSNFEYFLPVARNFDVVFTSDEDSIPRYVHELQHDRIFYGEYGVNPLLCNPIGSGRPPANAAFFAGSYPRRYPERCHDMDIVFSSIVTSGADLIIADRNYGAENPDILYPEWCQNQIIDKFEHSLLQRVHKLFRYNLNFNSIKDSSTMCAMRVYELQALGRGVLSNYARSVYNSFPRIKIVPEQQDLSTYFADFSAIPLSEQKRNMDGVLEVMTSKTSYDIAGKMLSLAGVLKAPVAPNVAVIVREGVGASIEAFNRQTYANKILLPDAVADYEAAWEDFKIANNIEYFVYFDEDNIYESRYIDSLMNAFKYTNAKYVTKPAASAIELGYELEHRFTEWMEGKARSCFCAREFSPAEFRSLAPLEGGRLAGGYACDRFEISSARSVASTTAGDGSFDLSVIVPVFNNGHHLVANCIDSVSRSRDWEKIELILVDDGSTDGATVEVCRKLDADYPNIKAYFFPQGGSGSASRPRNKGMELASAPLVSFLDPDNEIKLGGYDTLLDIFRELEAQGTPVDCVTGFQVKVGKSNTVTGMHTKRRYSRIENPSESYIKVGRFPVFSTQAAVIRKKVIFESGLRFVEGAAGQDTLFGWQLLSACASVAFTGDVYILYYHERERSVTNDIDAQYFRKKLTLEREQVRWLRDQGLLGSFVDKHLDSFVRKWYLPKVAQVTLEERAIAADILREIVRLYGVDPKVYNL